MVAIHIERHAREYKQGTLVTFGEALASLNKSVILWFVLLVTGSVFGMFTMTVLNVKTNRMKTVPLSTTTFGSSTSTIGSSTATTPAYKQKQVLLIMNTKFDSNIPLFTDLDGRNINANFHYGENTEVYESCMVLFNGQAYIFGGRIERRQISRVENCQLKSLALLDFEFNNGACASTASTIYLCFRSDATKSCRTGSDPKGVFGSIEESNFPHSWTRIASGPC